MPKQPDLPAGSWMPVWALIFQAAEDLRRSRDELETKEAGTPIEQKN